MKNNIFIGLAVILAGVSTFFFVNFYNNNSEGSNSFAKRYIQKQGNYEIFFTENILNSKPGESKSFIFKIKDPDGQILKNFDVVHEKLLHLIVIRQDLEYFQHLHPDYDPATGEFTVDIKFPIDGPYRLIAEFTPPKFEGNPKSIAVTAVHDVSVGNLMKYTEQKLTSDKKNTTQVGNYEITYHLPEQIKAGQEFQYTVSIQKDGHPLANMEEYLGALAHAIILQEGTLDFVHTHAGHDSHHTMSEMSSMMPELKFKATVTNPGLHKIFTEFQDEGKVVQSSFVFKAE